MWPQTPGRGWSTGHTAQWVCALCRGPMCLGSSCPRAWGAACVAEPPSRGGGEVTPSGRSQRYDLLCGLVALGTHLRVRCDAGGSGQNEKQRLDLAVLGNWKGEGAQQPLGEEALQSQLSPRGTLGPSGKARGFSKKNPRVPRYGGRRRLPQGQTEARRGKATLQQLSPQSEDVNDLEEEHRPIIVGQWLQLSSPHTQGRGGGLFPQPERSPALCQAT